MNKSSIILGALALVALSAPAQSTTKLTASKVNDYGIAYSLPITSFDIVVETQLTEKRPGEYANYANRYLNVNDAIYQPSYTATVKSVTVVPHGIPDPNNRWLMEFKGTGVTFMTLDEAGVPVSINTEVPQSASIELPIALQPAASPLETAAAKQAMTQEIISTTSESKRAQLMAQRIFDLRETRSDLISGNSENTPPDGKSMQLMLDNLEAQEAALTAMFVGTEKSWTDVQTITFTPGDKAESNTVIARISPIKGLVDADDLSGRPLYLSYDIISTGEVPTDANGAPKKPVKDGVAYNIPGTAQLTISFDGATLLSKDYEVAQLGKVFYLDTKIFSDKKSPAYLIFNPTTGGIATIGTVNKE